MDSPKDLNYERCKELLHILKTGEYGQLFTSNYIMVETATLVAVRTGKNARAMHNTYELFLGSKQIAQILRLNEEKERDAWKIFQKINDSTLSKVVSYVDCTIILLCQSYSIETILLYDNHFDGWINRIS
ncbi:MAG: type II toxin-antitoxin system VapC family toxin [Candidatus Helarchaeota archaeon]